MEKHPVALDEQESTINKYPKCFDGWADFYSSIPAEIKRFRKYAEQFPDAVKITSEDAYGICGKMQSSWVVIRPPRKRNMTEDQLNAAKERLAAARAAKQTA